MPLLRGGGGVCTHVIVSLCTGMRWFGMVCHYMYRAGRLRADELAIARHGPVLSAASKLVPARGPCSARVLADLVDELARASRWPERSCQSARAGTYGRTVVALPGSDVRTLRRARCKRRLTLT